MIISVCVCVCVRVCVRVCHGRLLWSIVCVCECLHHGRTSWLECVCVCVCVSVTVDCHDPRTSGCACVCVCMSRSVSRPPANNITVYMNVWSGVFRPTNSFSLVEFFNCCLFPGYTVDRDVICFDDLRFQNLFSDIHLFSDMPWYLLYIYTVNWKHTFICTRFVTDTVTGSHPKLSV